IRAKDYKGAETVSAEYSFTARTTVELETVIKAARTGGDLPKVYYVKPGGNNGSNGLSMQTAWATPSYAASVSQAGDTIYVDSGTYSGYLQFTNYNGIAEAPITMKAYDTANRPVIQSVMSIRANNITIDGFVCRHNGGGHGVDVRYVTGINILNCEASNPNGVDGMYLRNVTYSTIENCTVHDAGWNGIGLKPTSWHPSANNHIVIRNTEVYDCAKHNGIDLQGDYITIENCRSHNLDLAPLRANNGEYWVINRCTLKEGNHGIAKMGGDWQDILISNNEIHGPIGDANMNSAANMTVFNNHLPLVPGFSYGIQVYGGDDVLIEENEIYSSEANGYTYRVSGGSATLRNEESSLYKVRADSGASVTIEYTDGRTFSVDGEGDYVTYTFGPTSFSTHQIAVVPEPTTALLVVLGGLVLLRRLSGTATKPGLVPWPWCLRPR
ncbi:MAG: right-handed parallel beta-helix repeat-containing protein, partial [Phycisphaerae bacterium]|nr:right-handed parallel beta-helix repeat-containing protein [Phycisphaerae bacterium]